MTRRPRFRDGCLTALGCLGFAAVMVWVIVHAAAAWIAGHPAVPAVVVVLMALGGWGGPKVAARIGRPGAVPDFLALSPAEFEEAVADLCRRDGCSDVQRVGGAGDLAADILATTPRGRRMLVQCKRYTPGRRVGSPEVQRVGGTYWAIHRADLAIVITTSGYTAEAEEYAARAGIRLVDGAELAAWAGEKVLPPWGGERIMGA